MFLISFDYTGAVKWRFGISWFFSFRFRFPLEAYTACGHPVFKKLNIRSTQVILPRPAATPSKGGDGSEMTYRAATILCMLSLRLREKFLKVLLSL
mgnify:CR=1 FL=1